MNLFINDIYHSFEGEGIFVGIPQIFIRFQGCAIGCKNCDTKYTWEFKEESKIDFEKVKQKIITLLEKYNINRISITGGDPLHIKNRQGIQKIIKTFKSKATISIEASGNCIVPSIFDSVDFINFDYKTPSTGVKTNINHLKEIIQNYNKKSQIKSVVENEQDFIFLVNEKKKITSFTRKKFKWIITPAYNEKDTLSKVTAHTRKIINWNFEYKSNFTIIPQQHKIIYGNNKISI